jgi:hypothetical protein
MPYRVIISLIRADLLPRCVFLFNTDSADVDKVIEVLAVGGMKDSLDYLGIPKVGAIEYHVKCFA